MQRRFWKHAAFAVTAVILMGACRDAVAPRSLEPETAALVGRAASDWQGGLSAANSEWVRRYEADSLADCYTARFFADTAESPVDALNVSTCSSQMVVQPNAGDGYFSLWHSPDAVDGHGSADSLVVTFSRPVGMLVILREGQHSCYNEAFSRVVAYGPDGVELGRTMFRLIPTCREDNVPVLREGETASLGGTSAAASAYYPIPVGSYKEAELPIPAGVTRLMFLPPEAWYFTYPDPWYGDLITVTQSGNYRLIFRPERSAHGDSARVSCSPRTVVRGNRVVCMISVNQPRPFNVDVRSASALEPSVVFSTSGGADTGHDAGHVAEWAGVVVARTEVRVQVSMPDSAGTWKALPMAYDTIRITTRDSTFRDTIQEAQPERRKGFGPPVMMADYPGIVHLASGEFEIERGGIGMTWPLAPHFRAGRILSGPNKGLYFSREFRWKDPQPSAEADSIRAGVYIGAALFPNDRFYRAQVGGPNYCSSSDIETLSAETYQHELIHHARHIALRDSVRLHAVLESQLLMPSPAMTPDSIQKALLAPVLAYIKIRNRGDFVIDSLPSTKFKTSINCELRFP